MLPSKIRRMSKRRRKIAVQRLIRKKIEYLRSAFSEQPIYRPQQQIYDDAMKEIEVFLTSLPKPVFKIVLNKEELS